MKKYQSFFYLKSFLFWVVKFSIYLNRRVFVMIKHVTFRKKTSVSHLFILPLQSILPLKLKCQSQVQRKIILFFLFFNENKA